MGEVEWNMHMMPPKYAEYTKDEVNSELIHSSKAYYVCNTVAKAFAECRKKPDGKLVHPEICQNHADALMTCYNQVKQVPSECKNSYAMVFNCLNDKSQCNNQLKEYLGCYHPATKIYESYQ